MRLSDAEIARFEAEGYLFFPALLSGAEISPLLGDLPGLLARTGPEVVREADGDEAVRVMYGSHAFSEAYRRLSRHPKLVGPAEQLLRDGIYIHQMRLNPKLDFAGETWSWHQDFASWHHSDAMPEPRALVTAVFLDEASAANAPLLVVPGSQSHGLVDEVTLDRADEGYTLLEIDPPTLKAMVEARGLKALTGPPGSVAFLHCNIVHGSANNITPLRRAVIYAIYNAVSNACVGGGRAWHHAGRDFTPIEALAEDCLLALAAERDGDAIGRESA
ncbi:MAG: phytanoyl-CoA dioxygenase family protein [Kiloniellales bacterium]|nr:phytanoyl-CoA dioxygenase family protein [Kiloniellales bacterium]